MRLLERGAATAIATVVSFGVNAADLGYPPPLIGQPQYGMASPPPAQPPQVIIVPGPNVPPQYPSVAVPPPPVGVAPPATCPPTWRCGERGCGWQPGCAPPLERYSGHYELPRPGYLRPEPPPEPYRGPYVPEVYPGPTGPYSR